MVKYIKITMKVKIKDVYYIYLNLFNNEVVNNLIIYLNTNYK